MVNTKKRVGIQGGSGSYHEIASILHFGIENITTVPFDTFNDLVEAVENQTIDYAVMAIENTVAGSLMPNYLLLESSDILITGEILLRIEHNLLALDGQTIDQLNEVHSHPMALMQCHKFLKNNKNLRLVETDDTANSAKRIKENQLMGVSAIASHRAAGLFGLSVIEPGIETNKRNFTRFLVLKNKQKVDISNQNKDNNKASISFSLFHETGCLSKVLSIFSFYDINLSKIQSIPIIGKEWQYHFLVDFVYKDYEIYQQALVAIQPLIDELQILGEYQKADKYYKSNEVTSSVNVETMDHV